MPLDTVGDKATLEFCISETPPNTSSTWTPLSTIVDITPNKVSVKEVDTTNLDSDAETQQPGTPNYGEVAITLVYQANNTVTVNGWAANKTMPYFRLSVDDGATTDSSEVFPGFVKEWDPMASDLKKDERALSKLTLKVADAPDFTAGS
jgi:hypothetical protein